MSDDYTESPEGQNALEEAERDASEALPGDEVHDSLLKPEEREPDWKDTWRGMPSYDHKDLQPDTTLLVHFQTKADRASFAKLIGQPLTEKTKFVWHPRAEIRKASDKVFTGEKVVPRYPVYIISKGRADTRLTSRALEWIGVPYHIVVEPQELEQYAAAGIAREKILVTPFSNLGQGGIPARNFVWEHAIATGAERHWILDDNIAGFCRFQDNLKVELDNGATFCAAEDFVDRYENMAMAAFNYDYFAPRKQGAKIKPITINTRCYSGILLSNTMTAHRWRGRYNEDTDLSLRILKDGLCTVLFNALLMYKKPTLTMKGGNTDELYKGAEAMAAEWEAHAEACKQCAECTDGYPTEAAPNASPCEAGRIILSRDGRWLMAESLREQHPDVTTVERKWRRWQHQVDYRRFNPRLGLNEPRLRPGIIITDNEYGLELDAMPVAGSTGSFYQGEVASQAASRTPSTQAGGQPGPSAMDFVRRLGEQPETTEGVSKPEPEDAAPTAASPTVPAPEPGPTDAEALAESLAVRGHRLMTRDGKFFVSEASRLTDVDRLAIKVHREALIGLAEPVPVVAGAPPQLEEGVMSPSEGSIPSPAPNVDDVVAGVSRPSVYDAARTAPSSDVDPSRATSSDVRGAGPEAPSTRSGHVAPSTSLFEAPRSTQTLAQFLGSGPPRVDPGYKQDEPPDLTGIDEIVLNFATNGLDWHAGHRPVGVTVSTLDGQLCRFLPFAFAGGNLSEDAIKRWAKENVRGKKITNSKTKFDVHMSREWGVDLEEQGCTFSDIQHTAALLDDHRKRFALDVLAADYFPNEQFAGRIWTGEERHSDHHASEVAERERVTAQLVGRLRAVMYPELDKQELRGVQRLEDDVIPAVVEMERNGSPLDLELLEQFHVEANRKHDELLWEVAKECGFAFDHTAKGWQRLFESLNLPATEGNAEATIGAIDHPTVKKAHLAAQYASLDSKTFKAYRENVGSDGVLRFEINQLRSDEGGTVSGRFSIGYVQQVPNADNHSAVFGDELFPRRLFIPMVGDYLEADAMQIEQRLLVHHMDNAAIIKEYEGDLERLMRGEETVSFHKVTWAMIKAYKPDMLYSHQKSFNFAKQYGARSIKLAVMMGFITEAEGDEIRRAKRWDDPRLKVIKEIEAAYKKMVPEGDALLERASHLAKPECDEYCRRGDKLHRLYPHRGFVKTIEGRRSRFPTNYKTYIGLNRVLQGTGADIMKRKLTELHRERKHTGLVMRLTVHDAVGGDATLPETKARVSEVLNAQSYPLKVDILWSVNTGRNWASCK